MQRLIFVFLFFVSIGSFGQKASSPAGDYYLLDTTRLPKNANMWDISQDRPYKYNVIECSCLDMNGKPALIYNLNSEAELINKKQLQQLNFLTLPQLIAKAKNILNNYITNYDIYLVEPIGDLYTVHKVTLRNVEKQIKDYQFVSPNDSINKKKP
jgi:hypothetical protein